MRLIRTKKTNESFCCLHITDALAEQTQEIVKFREAWSATVMGLQRVRHELATEQRCVLWIIYKLMF